nr:hypothetical protein [Tanacetum cinerariifolium]
MSLTFLKTRLKWLPGVKVSYLDQLRAKSYGSMKSEVNAGTINRSIGLTTMSGDESVHPEPAPIISDHAPVQLDSYLSDVEVEDEEKDPKEDPEEETIEQLMPEPNNMNGFALHPNPQEEGNMNGWLIEDDDEEEEVEEMDEDEMEVDDNGKEDGEDNVEDEVEVINPYEEVDPLNRPPPGSNEEFEFTPPAVPVVDGNLEPIPPIVQFGGNFHVGESSSTEALLAGNGWVHAPGPMGYNLETVHKKVRTLDRQMSDRYNTERRMVKKSKEDDLRMNRHEYDISALDTALREESSDHSKMMQLVESLSRQYNEFQNGKGAPSEPHTNPAFVPLLDDPYAIVRDVATSATRDDGDDLAVPNDSHSSQPCGAPRADNRPPMLEKDMYDSWKSIMKLYMLNRQHGRMILESVDNGPLLWPTVKENGATRPKKYNKLSVTEAIQADCDVKATNIILQGLLPESISLAGSLHPLQQLARGRDRSQQILESSFHVGSSAYTVPFGSSMSHTYLSPASGWGSGSHFPTPEPTSFLYSTFSIIRVISTSQSPMTSLADKAILSGTDNRPPMLEKDMYGSWKSRMELYMLNRQCGRMILEYVKNDPFLWLTVEEDGVTRLKKYSELSKPIKPIVTSKLQTSFFKDFPRRFMHWSALIRLQKNYGKEFILNKKFFNTLPPKWSKFVTDVKLVRDIHTKNVDQLHAYLGQHEYHANEYESHDQTSTPLSITYPSSDFQSSIHHNVYNPSSYIPQVKYAPSVHQQSDFSQPDTGLVVPVFQKGDDPIDTINYMMSFLTAIVTSQYPPTNN